MRLRTLHMPGHLPALRELKMKDYLLLERAKSHLELLGRRSSPGLFKNIRVGMKTDGSAVLEVRNKKGLL